MGNKLKFQTKKELVNEINKLENQLSLTIKQLAKANEIISQSQYNKFTAPIRQVCSNSLNPLLKEIPSIACAIPGIKDSHKDFIAKSNEYGSVDGFNHGLVIREIDLLKQGSRLQAIKDIKDRLNIGLKEAKDLVDAFCLKYKY